MLMKRQRFELMHFVGKVQVSDTTDDAMKNLSWYHKKIIEWVTGTI
jgi:hypothetical protein